MRTFCWINCDQILGQADGVGGHCHRHERDEGFYTADRADGNTKSTLTTISNIRPTAEDNQRVLNYLVDTLKVTTKIYVRRKYNEAD